jgi:hypothetical protein
MRAMIVRIPMQTAATGVRHVAVFLPYVDCLVADQPGKYAATPEDFPPATRADVQPIGRQRRYHAHHFYRRRRMGEPLV